MYTEMYGNSRFFETSQLKYNKYPWTSFMLSIKYSKSSVFKSHLAYIGLAFSQHDPTATLVLTTWHCLDPTPLPDLLYNNI